MPPDTMESRIAQIERMMQDPTLPHSDQQLLDQELDELMRRMDAADELLEPEDDGPVMYCWSCGERGHVSAACTAPPAPPLTCANCHGEGAVHSWMLGDVPVKLCGDCVVEELNNIEPHDSECPCCTNERCADCGQTGHMNRHDGEILCDYCVEHVVDNRGCASCSGCAYCTDGYGYDGADEV